MLAWQSYSLYRMSLAQKLSPHFSFVSVCRAGSESELALGYASATIRMVRLYLMDQLPYSRASVTRSELLGALAPVLKPFCGSTIRLSLLANRNRHASQSMDY